MIDENPMIEMMGVAVDMPQEGAVQFKNVALLGRAVEVACMSAKFGWREFGAVVPEAAPGDAKTPTPLENFELVAQDVSGISEVTSHFVLNAPYSLDRVAGRAARLIR